MGITTIRMLVAPGAEAQAHTGIGVVERAALVTEFPTVAFFTETDPAGREDERPTIELERWLDATVDFGVFDAAVDDLVARGPACLVVAGPWSDVLRGTWEMLTRWQRHLDRRNEASRTRDFDAVLARLRSVPVSRADGNRGIDTWQWMLRLDPRAPAAAQMAALLRHIEHPAWLLKASGIGAPTDARIAELLALPDGTSGDPDASLLDDADGLSFFSQNSDSYLDEFDAAQTARKIAYTLSRMSSGAVARLARVRLRADVAEILSRVRTRGAAA